MNVLLRVFIVVVVATSIFTEAKVENRYLKRFRGFGRYFFGEHYYGSVDFGEQDFSRCLIRFY